MKRYFILSEYDDGPWGEADTIEEARAIKETIIRDFISDRVVIIDTINNDTVSLLSYANDDNYGRITININDIVGIQFQ